MDRTRLARIVTRSVAGVARRPYLFLDRDAAVMGRLTFSRLSVIALSDAADGKIFIEIGPVEAKRRQLDLVQLRGRGAGEARIFRRSEPQFGATL